MADDDQTSLFNPPPVAAAPGKVLELEFIGEAGVHYGFDDTRQKIKAAGEIGLIRGVIHSIGGSIFEGFSIFAELDLHPAAVEMEVRFAASIASVIAMAADPGKIRIHSLGRLMIHKGTVGFNGTDDEHRAAADLMTDLDTASRAAYGKHSKWTDAAIAAAMEATTWLKAPAALEAGFVSEVVEGADPVGRLDLSPLGALVPPDVRQDFDQKMAPPPRADADVLDRALAMIRKQRSEPADSHPLDAAAVDSLRGILASFKETT